MVGHNMDSPAEEKKSPSEHSRSEPEAETAAAFALDDSKLSTLGYQPELHRNRSLITLLFQSLAIAAIPYGEGSPLISAIYGGGQLSIFLGWVRLKCDFCRVLYLRWLTNHSLRLLFASWTNA